MMSQTLTNDNDDKEDGNAFEGDSKGEAFLFQPVKGHNRKL